MEAGTRIAVLAPTLLFLVMVLWHYFFCSELEDHLSEADPKRHDMFEKYVASHYFRIAFAEAVIVFCVNGAIILGELKQYTGGIAELLVGVLMAISGLIVSVRLEKRNLRGKIFVATIAFACGQAGYLGTYDQGIVLPSLIQAFVDAPFLAFVLVFLVAIVVLQATLRP